MKIQDIMSSPVLTCRPTDSLREAAQLMWEHDCGALPVTDGDGAIVGMVTDRDICMGAYLKGAPLDAIPVSAVMARQVHACRPSDTVDKAERVMSANQVRRLPVIDGGRQLVGFLSMSDVVRQAASRHAASSGRAVAETLAAISQPRAAAPEARALHAPRRARSFGSSGRRPRPWKASGGKPAGARLRVGGAPSAWGAAWKAGRRPSVARPKRLVTGASPRGQGEPAGDGGALPDGWRGGTLRRMSDPRGASELLAFARKLLHVTTFEELLVVAQAEIAASLGYQHAWLFVAETPDAEVLRLLDVASAREGLVREHADLLVVRGDAMLEEILGGDAPVVVVDARTDPRTNKDIVAKIGNRTIINVPLRLIDKPFGALGTGTFGEEGCRPPSHQDLEYLIGMSAHLAVAAGRIRFLDERKAAELVLRRTEAQLREAQKMEAIGQLAGGIAHDFNNLLSVILSYATIATDGLPQGSPARADLEQIALAGQRAAELTRQLLAFSRQQVVEPRVLDLDLVIRNIATLIGRVISEDIELVVRPGGSLGKIRADAGQLDQVLLNLVVNARDAMPGGGRLVLETANVELDAEYASAHLGVTPGPYVRLAVSDTGVGMTPEVQARIFEPFFTTKEQGRGTGLGLATVYGIVRQAGGHLWVYSEPGSGTTFRLYFPRVDSEADEPRAPSPPVTTLVGTETILLTEDNAQVREVVRSVLERSGYHVLVASGGDEAVALAESAARPVDLLLTDVVMPGVTGPELAAKLRSRWPALRVLCMSGYTGGLLASQGRLAEGLPLLEKPVTPPALLRKVREVLDAPST